MAFALLLFSGTAPAKNVHVWEMVEITLEAENTYINPYMDVDIWVILKGPGFDKKVYGFWDGGNVFKVKTFISKILCKKYMFYHSSRNMASCR